MTQRSSWFGSLIAVGSLTHFAVADIGITRIADSHTLIPGTAFTYQLFGPPRLSDGIIAFAGGGGTIDLGIYSTAGGLHTVADTTTMVPSGYGSFTSLEGSLSTDGTNIAFPARGAGGQTGVYLAGSSLSVVSNQNTPIPGWTGNFIGFSSAHIRAGEVSFIGFSGPGQPGIYQTTPGGLARVADRTTQVPGWPSSLTFASFPALAMDEEQVAFTATANLSPGQFPGVGVYSTKGGVLHAVADRNTPVPGGTGLMRNFSFFLSADEGNIAFAHSSTDFEESISANFDDVLQVLVDTGDLIPGAEGEPFDNHFFQFGQVALSGRNIVFFANNVELTHAGFYALYEGELLKIMEWGDTFQGKTVSNLGMTAESFDGHQFAFRAEFTDGSSGIYLAHLPEPASGLLVLLSATAGLTRRR